MTDLWVAVLLGVAGGLVGGAIACSKDIFTMIKLTAELRRVRRHNELLKELYSRMSSTASSLAGALDERVEK